MTEKFNETYQQLCDAEKVAREKITTRQYLYTYYSDYEKAGSRYPHSNCSIKSCINVFNRVIRVEGAKDSGGGIEYDKTIFCDGFDNFKPCSMLNCSCYAANLAYIQAKKIADSMAKKMVVDAMDLSK